MRAALFRLAMAALLASSVVELVAGGVSTAASTATPIGARFHPLFPHLHGHTVTSANWSGYAITSATSTGVEGTWVVPAVSGQPAPGYSSSWVGIGGYNSNDLIQAGTEQDINGNGQPSYYAWWEILPAPETPISMTIHPGDSMLVVIHTKHLDQNSTWRIFIKDQTTGATFVKTVTYNSSFSSAEWIEEAPTVNGQIAPLADFGTVTFNNCQVFYNGSLGNISSGPNTAIDLQDPNGQVAAPGPLSNNSETFSDTWGA
jgi:hypothetical protein